MVETSKSGSGEGLGGAIPRGYSTGDNAQSPKASVGAIEGTSRRRTEASRDGETASDAAQIR